MKPEMIKLSLSANVPCGFRNSEGKIQTDAKMTDLLFKLIRTPEMKTLIEKVQTERSPFFVICHFPSDYNKAPKVWQFHFLPLFDKQNGYIGTFFHAHEFLFLSPLEYVDGMQPYAVTTEKPNKLFTDREWDILFFTMHRLSSKDGIFHIDENKAYYGAVGTEYSVKKREAKAESDDVISGVTFTMRLEDGKLYYNGGEYVKK